MSSKNSSVGASGAWTQRESSSQPDHHASKRGLQRADREVLLEAPHAIGHDRLEHRGALVVAVKRREERGVPLEIRARVGRRHRCFIGQSYGRGRERREGRRAEQRSTPRHRRRRRFGAGRRPPYPFHRMPTRTRSAGWTAPCARPVRWTRIEAWRCAPSARVSRATTCVSMTSHGRGARRSDDELLEVSPGGGD